ncbi:UNVERIFIED_CONTAM: hypothetical protein PYX00_007611 [Menopon gallinae]|uniref:ubiquitinyl hydrolase 1 n=1 Tax=Menopon gallinae TaxID=328185 RepID=A0AAW2HJU8_9NEOP
MCDVCADFVGLLLSYDDKFAEKFYEITILKKSEVEVIYQFIQSFNQRQCMCVFRDSKNFERFSYFTQCIVHLAILELKDLHKQLSNNAKAKVDESNSSDEGNKSKDDDGNTSKRKATNEEKESGGKGNEETKEVWDMHEKEKLFNFLSKLFLMNFPLYQAYKLSCHSKSEEISQHELSSLSVFCEVNDMEIPFYLVRNVTVFCKNNGVQYITKCFDGHTPDSLPVPIAHALISVVCNVKLWLNIRSIVTLFVPLRSKVLKYMCSLHDKDLRLPGIKNMAEYMWNAIKEPFDSPPTFDRDGLELAFKYFTSSTLTMRLAGIAQINSYISVFNELCNNENMIEVESVGQSLADWLIQVQIISHIFGPNLHVEVIKQSHIILNFLAMECKITNEHIDIIWQAAQLKHCSKQVHDLLPPFINNLETGPVLHLYNLLCKLEPKDHTEQSLFLASALIKFIWTSGGTYHLADELPFLSMNKGAIADMKMHHHEITSSENSISPEASITEDEQADSSQLSELHKTPSEGSEGPTPCKKARKHIRDKRISHGQRLHSSDESIKVEDVDEEEEDEAEEEEDEEEENEDEDDEDEDEEVENSPVISHVHSLAVIQQRLLNKEKRLKSNLRGGEDPTQRKKDTLLKEIPLELLKDYCGELSNKKGTEEEKKELMKELLKTAKLEQKREQRRKLKGEPGSEEDADGEKSGSEDVLVKQKKKKVLKKRKFSPNIVLQEKNSGDKRKCSEEEDTDESDGETKNTNQKSIKDNKRYSAEKEQKPKCEVEQPVEESSHDSTNTGMVGIPCTVDSSGVMTELANLVRNEDIHGCTSFFLDLHQGRDLVEEMSVDEGGSYSSRMSNKSEKNMDDFEGEDSGCEEEEEEELVQFTSNTIRLSDYAFPTEEEDIVQTGGKISCRPRFTRINTHFKMDNVCKPGNTLLWDLLQDDKIEQLGENLAAEAEKILSNLLCFNTERLIRMKFIEGCLENLSMNWSVVVSLRLLPKLFASFQEFRGTNTHAITTWAEHKLHMMKHFFNNLQVYSLEGPKFYSHQTEINVRLQFLSSVFSPMGSPDCFRLSLAQVDTLWSCLATDPQCSDELFSWLLNNARSKGHQHALGIDALKYLYMKKLPSLPPETMSMVGLTLFQQLHNLARYAFAQTDPAAVRDVDLVGMDYLWKVALRANNTDISMSAIQYINQYYMSRHLENEEEFICQCMSYLASASRELNTSEESSLLCIQRALVLLKTHLETFKRRYAYHLRRWMLEGKSVGSHVQIMSGDRGYVPIRVVIQPAGLTEKTTLELLSSDYVAELRAEVAKWWENIQQKRSKEGKDTPVLGALLTDGPIRMITQGQELTPELDEKTLQEMMFKDSQLVYISVGAARPQKIRDAADTPSVLPPPPRENLPTHLLLQPLYFEQLFQLMQTLSAMKTPVKGSHQIPHTKAQVLSRRIWDILTLLPTSPKLLQGFQSLESSNEVKLQELLDPSSPQKLMYSLYIVESLCRPAAGKKQKVLSQGERNAETTNSWTETFVQQGGLRHLFDIFMSGALQRGDGSEWQQDCLATLLKLLCQLGMAQSDKRNVEHVQEPEGIGRNKQRRMKKSNLEKPVPRLNETMLQMLNTDGVMERLTSILYEASLPRDPNHYKTGFWGRAQVVHYAMSLLVSWVHSGDSVRETLFNTSNLFSRLQRLVLEDPEPAVRREVCTALYRLCLGNVGPAESNENYPSLVTPMLNKLLDFLHIAESMGPQKYESLHPAAEDGKEPYGPACRDYFWLLCRLVDSLPQDLAKESIEDPQGCLLDIDALARSLANSIVTRDYLESRHNTVEDSGLIGLLNLETNVVKHFPPFKTSKEGQEFVLQLFDFLFALPNPKKRYLPKCKSQLARSSTYDLLVEMVRGAPDNYMILHGKLLSQHQQGPHYPYPWDYWPHEDGRSDCGYVGLTNLGATCYMASCMQHLYMMPQARSSILDAKCNSGSKHEETLKELQRMFAYLMESERKAYNPRSFCKVYTMDHQPLNTGEQKDMAEFFIDLVSKLEEMTPELKKLVKTLFGGVISNNVVSLDCGHVSRTLEEFYTVRCQVTDMRNIYESLDEVTVKDTLEGDNMYTCSQCGKKVRAEKRACFKKLPHILCFNTMRYTFNMLTMLKEKVNTLFSFPLRLDMSGYVEKHLMPQHYQEQKLKSQLGKSDELSDWEDFNEKYEYDLIGVTVHTGTADGGHYYSFIRDRTTSNRDKWFLFNDAEVKPFDPNQLAAECFGGEMTSKTYDSVNDKFMDFSFEKTNSAYMLFYEWCSESGEQRGAKDENSECGEGEQSSSKETSEQKTVILPQFELSKDLEDWIWQDNMHFLRDKNIFEHTYFNFMWQICGHIPQTLVSQSCDITELAAELSTSFFLETYIHAKEKPMMVQWVELVTKQFVSSRAACEWFLGHMARSDWWPVQILIKCPNQMIRQMFQRLCIHVIQQLRQSHVSLYLKSDSDDETVEDSDIEKIGTHSCVTMFVRKLLSLLEYGTAKAHLKNLTEYFVFLYEFSKMGEIEAQFLIAIQAISTMVNFYLGHKATDFVEVLSEEEEEEDAVPPPTDKYKPASLEKMITLIATLAEKSRGPDNRLELTEMDMNAVAGGKWFPFIYQQTKDAINLNQTRNLIFALCQYNDRLAQMIVTMIFQTIARHTEISQPFLKLLTLLTDPTNTPPAYTNSEGMPSFSQYVLQGIWDIAEICPIPILDWLALQVSRNPLAHSLVLQSLDQWVEPYLMQNCNQRVRTAAAYLLVSLVPNAHFKQHYRSARGLMHPRDLLMNQEAQSVLHEIYMLLLRKLKVAKKYSDVQEHGPNKLTAYFTLLLYCCPTKTEKLMFAPFFMDLWNLFLPNLSEPSISVHYNKQALLSFWHHVCVDCPENVNLILSNPSVTKNIAFNYILADHEDTEVVIFNRAMLPSYYGILRLCCQQSKQFTRHLANHQNLNWAFKNITPYPTQYTAAVEELFKLMQLFATKYPDMSEQEINEVNIFRKSTIQLYLQNIDARTSWATLISAFRILVETEEERLFAIYNNGIQKLFEAFQTLHTVYHDSSTCHVASELMELLGIMMSMLKTLSMSQSSGSNKDARTTLSNCKDWVDVLRKLATLQNSYNPSEMRNMALDLLKEILMIMPREVIQVLTPLLSHCHSAFQESSTTAAFPMGPYFPRKGIKLPNFGIKAHRRPMVQMAVPNTLVEPKGQNEDYDIDLLNYYSPYHNFIDVMCRLAINHNCMSEALIQLSAIVGFEGAPLHLIYFPKLWLEIYTAPQLDKKFVTVLLSNNFFIDYIETILLDERTSLNVPVIYKFLCTFFPKVASRVLSDNTCQIIDNLVMSLNQKVQQMDVKSMAYQLNADLRALKLVYSNVDVPIAPPNNLVQTLHCLIAKVRMALSSKSQEKEKQPKKKKKREATEEEEEEEVEESEEKEPEKEVSQEEAPKPEPEQPAPSKPEAAKGCCSDPSDMSDFSASPKSVDWLVVLESTIIRLIATLKKNV